MSGVLFVGVHCLLLLLHFLLSAFVTFSLAASERKVFNSI